MERTIHALTKFAVLCTAENPVIVSWPLTYFDWFEACIETKNVFDAVWENNWLEIWKRSFHEFFYETKPGGVNYSHTLSRRRNIGLKEAGQMQGRLRSRELKGWKCMDIRWKKLSQKRPQNTVVFINWFLQKIILPQDKQAHITLTIYWTRVQTKSKNSKKNIEYILSILFFLN